MQFKSLDEIVRFLESKLALNFYSGAGVLRKSVLKVLAAVIGGAIYMLSLLAKNIWKNRFVSTCDVSALDGFGVEYGLPHKAATYARGRVSVALSSGSSSATIPADTFFVDPVTNKEYRTITPVTITASALTVMVIAAEPGSASNLDVGAELSFRDAAPTGLEDGVTVAAGGLIGGYSVDVVVDGELYLWGESAEEYRARLLNRIQNQPQGGSDNDYKIWAEHFDFVSNAFVIPNQPVANAVCVVLANFNSQSIALTTAQVNEVSTYINAPDRRCITADVRVFSATPVIFTVNARVAPFTADVKESVTNALKRIVRGIEPGKQMLFDQVVTEVKSNSLAETFVIDSVLKAGVSVDRFEMTFDGSNSLGQVASLGVNLSNGEA